LDRQVGAVDDHAGTSAPIIIQAAELYLQFFRLFLKDRISSILCLAAWYSARRRGFFTPFLRRFLGGSELASRDRSNGLGSGYSDIFAGLILSDPALLEND
jgi:hypothetical protein